MKKASFEQKIILVVLKFLCEILEETIRERNVSSGSGLLYRVRVTSVPEREGGRC